MEGGLICACMLSCVQLFATPWIVAHQAPLSMGFPRQEYWSRLPFSTPGHLPDPGMEPSVFCIGRQILYLCTNLTKPLTCVSIMRTELTAGHPVGSGELVSVGKLSQHISTGHKIFNVCIDISWLLDFFFFFRFKHCCSVPKWCPILCDYFSFW